MTLATVIDMLPLAALLVAFVLTVHGLATSSARSRTAGLVGFAATAALAALAFLRFATSPPAEPGGGTHSVLSTWAVTLATVSTLGSVALAGLIVALRRRRLPTWFLAASLLLAIPSAAWLGRAAEESSQVSRTGLTSGAASVNGTARLGRD